MNRKSAQSSSGGPPAPKRAWYFSYHNIYCSFLLTTLYFCKIVCNLLVVKTPKMRRATSIWMKTWIEKKKLIWNQLMSRSPTWTHPLRALASVSYRRKASRRRSNWSSRRSRSASRSRAVRHRRGFQHFSALASRTRFWPHGFERLSRRLIRPPMTSSSSRSISTTTSGRLSHSLVYS